MNECKKPALCAWPGPPNIPFDFFPSPKRLTTIGVFNKCTAVVIWWVHLLDFGFFLRWPSSSCFSAHFCLGRSQGICTTSSRQIDHTIHIHCITTSPPFPTTRLLLLCIHPTLPSTTPPKGPKLTQEGQKPSLPSTRPTPTQPNPKQAEAIPYSPTFPLLLPLRLLCQVRALEQGNDALRRPVWARGQLQHGVVREGEVGDLGHGGAHEVAVEAALF